MENGRGGGLVHQVLMEVTNLALFLPNARRIEKLSELFVIKQGSTEVFCRFYTFLGVFVLSNNAPVNQLCYLPRFTLQIFNLSIYHRLSGTLGLRETYVSKTELSNPAIFEIASV